MFQKGASKAAVEGRPQESDMRCEARQRGAEQSMLLPSWFIAEAPAIPAGSLLGGERPD